MGDLLTSPSPPRAFLLGLDSPDSSGDGFPADESVRELALLVDTWGGQVVGRLFQTRLRADPAWYIGRGKLAEAAEAVRASQADVVVADSELSPVQLRNLERDFAKTDLDVRVIDRTQVILEIFARRAQSREGKLEVDLAQAVYALPRLAGKGLVLSRLGGGIGTRGPGETKLEVDRRHLRERITFLKREIAKVGRQRAVQARSRREAAAPLVALVGYTNAGKSTLFNRLTGADVLVEDKLFATLDPVVRRLELPGNQRVLVSDTVGFIRKLPHHLVAAFRATLDEVRQADILVHVVDVANPRWPAYVEAARDVLVEVGVPGTPVIYALNKIDLLPASAAGTAAGNAAAAPAARELSREARVVALSAATGSGVGDLLGALAAELSGRRQVFALKVPYDQTGVLSLLYERGRILKKEYAADGVAVEVELEAGLGRRVKASLEGQD